MLILDFKGLDAVSENKLRLDLRKKKIHMRAVKNTLARGGTMRGQFSSDQPPGWLSGEEFERAVAEFERTGFAAALNRYRCMDQDWDDAADYDTAVLAQPSLFIVGEQDSSRTWLAHDIERHTTTLPGLRSQHVLSGVGHWVQQEAPDAVSEILLDWLRQVHVGGS